jgi:hypothetical protein
MTNHFRASFVAATHPIRAAIFLVASLAVFLASELAQGQGVADGKQRPAPMEPQVAAARVDQLLAEELFTSDVQLAPLADDATFLRRVQLDLIGQVPPPEVVRAFLADRSPDKRRRMITSLLADQRFGEHWARYWSDVVLYRRIEDTALRVAAGGVPYLTEAFNSGKGWNQVAKEMITAIGPVDENGQTMLIVAQNAQTEELTSEIARIFLGVQIQCAQCHDHPSDRWTREQFHELAAFFPRVALRPAEAGDRASLAVMADDRGGRRGRPAAVASGRRGSAEHTMPDQYDPSLPGTVVRPEFFLTGDWLPIGATDWVRRDAVGDWITQNEWFAKAYVNRMWSELVGEGFYEPVDDLGPDRKGVALPTLDSLAEGFIASGHDAKWLAETIVLSDAYGRESRPRRASNETPFTANVAQPLRPDVFSDVLTTVLDIRPGRRGARDGAMMDRPLVARGGLAGQVNDAFGFDPSNPRDEIDATIPQALFLMNHPQISRRVQAEGGRGGGGRGVARGGGRIGPIARGGQAPQAARGARQARGRGQQAARRGGRQGVLPAVEPLDARAIEDLYVRILSRPPQPSELAIVWRYAAETDAPREVLEDLTWSLINSTEFLYRR